MDETIRGSRNELDNRDKQKKRMGEGQKRKKKKKKVRSKKVEKVSGRKGVF